MTKNTSLKEELKEIMKITKGKVRGAAIQTHVYYIQEKKGKMGVRMVEEKLRELGCFIELNKIKAMEWYPTGFADLVIVVAKKIFNWTDKDVFDMGNNAPKYSFIVRLLMKYFLSPQRVFKESPKYWRKHFTSGVLETQQFNEKEKYMVVRLKHRCHPTLCTFYRGYFLRIAQYTIKSEKITIEETKCMTKGEPYHEFIIKWI